MKTKHIVVAGASALALGALAVPALAGDSSPTSVVSENSRRGFFTDVLDGLVADGVIDDSQATAIEEAFSEAFSEHARPIRDHGERFLEPAAAAIGIEPSELLDGLLAGETVAQIAEANGVDTDDVIADLVASATTRVTEAADAGYLSKEMAARIIDGLDERIEALVNGEFPGRAGMGRHGGFGDGPWGDLWIEPTEGENS